MLLSGLEPPPRKRDLAFLEHLLEEYGPVLYQEAAKRGRSQLEAERAIQRVLINVLARRAEIKALRKQSQEHQVAYLYTELNQVLMEQDEHTRTPGLDVMGADVELVPTFDRGGPGLRGQVDQLTRTISRLPYPYDYIIEAKYVLHKDVDTICGALGISRASLALLTHRAKRALTRRIKKEANGRARQ